MRRLAALVVVQTLLFALAAGSSLHVHEYVGHDHPEHHHGPATHEHAHSVAEAHHASETDDHHIPVVRPEPCDPGQHAVTIAMRCACVLQVHVDVVELPGTVIVVAPAPYPLAVPVSDVRAHGPPFDSRIPSRAPPLTPHA